MSEIFEVRVNRNGKNYFVPAIHFDIGRANVTKSGIMLIFDDMEYVNVGSYIYGLSTRIAKSELNSLLNKLFPLKMARPDVDRAQEMIVPVGELTRVLATVKKLKPLQASEIQLRHSKIMDAIATARKALSESLVPSVLTESAPTECLAEVHFGEKRSSSIVSADEPDDIDLEIETAKNRLYELLERKAQIDVRKRVLSAFA